MVSPETTAGILGALRGAEAAAAADAPGAFVAFPGCAALYASLLGARPAGGAPAGNPSPNPGGWAVPAAAAAALAEVYARAQAVASRAGAARADGAGAGFGGGNPVEDEGERAAEAAQRVLEAARGGQAISRLCRCLEDCAGDARPGLHLLRERTRSSLQLAAPRSSQLLAVQNQLVRHLNEFVAASVYLVFGTLSTDFLPV